MMKKVTIDTSSSEGRARAVEARNAAAANAATGRPERKRLSLKFGAA